MPYTEESLEKLDHEFQKVLKSLKHIAVHSPSEKESNTICIHAQVLADGATVLELCDIYCKYSRVAPNNNKKKAKE